MTAQQLALKELTEQVERQRMQLELHKAQLAKQPIVTGQPGLPKNMEDIMSGKTLTNEGLEPRPLNMMDYLQRKIASKQPGAVTMEAPPLPPSMSMTAVSKGASVVPPLPSAPTAVAPPTRHITPPSPPGNLNPREKVEMSERPKISFSLAGTRNVPQPTQHLTEEVKSPHRPYLPPSQLPNIMPKHSYQQPERIPPSVAAPLLPIPGEHLQSAEKPATNYKNIPTDPRSASVSRSADRLPFAPAGDEYGRGGVHGDYDYRQPPDPRPRWKDDYNDRSRWRGADRGYQGPPHRGSYDNTRGRYGRGYGQHDRYRRDY